MGEVRGRVRRRREGLVVEGSVGVKEGEEITAG